MDIQTILATYDSPDLKGFDEYNISTELRKIVPQNNEEISPELLSEIMAFSFVEDYQNKETGWGTYFGPMTVWSNGDGTATETPSIKLITPIMLDYWEQRAKESKNPIMVARYAGLVYDFSNRIKGTNPPAEISKIYINALVTQAIGEYQNHAVHIYKKLERALSISISLNDKQLIEQCKKAIIDYENKHSDDS